MGKNGITKLERIGSALLVCALALLLTAPAQAAAPTHVRHEALDVTGLNHACGAAVDSKGDLYLSSAGESKVNVYDPSHNLLTQITDANTPCGLAVTTTGVLYVSERATGEVVRFKPNAYPFAGTPTYGAREVIDNSGTAKGISVDAFDNRLYVAEGNRVSAYDSEGNLGTNEVQRVLLFEVTGGTFKLKFGGQETASIPFSAEAPEVKAALEALSSIGAGNVSVTRPKEKEFFVTFTGALGHQDVEMLQGDKSGLTGGTPNIIIEETTKGWGGRIGEGTLSEASGVAAYTAEPTELKFGVPGTDRYLWVADAAGVAADRLDLFSAPDIKSLKLHREITGSATPDGSLGFGTAGAYLTADPGTIKAKKCAPVGEEACTAGHIFLYDAAHKALDEFDDAGEYLGQTKSAAFADAEPSALAIDRSGTANDGTLYLTAGAGSGATALAFRPLTQPARETLAEPLSHTLASAGAVATDVYGDVYVKASAKISIFNPKGTEITSFEDAGAPTDLALDSKCNVYVLDGTTTVTYYSPSESKCPPSAGTTYTRHEPAIATASGFPTGNKSLRGIAVSPGPGASKDHLFVTAIEVTREYKSAAEGSAQLNAEFAPKTVAPGHRESIAVGGVNDNVYFGMNGHLIYVVNAAGTEVLARIDTTISTAGTTGANPHVAVDQANGHVIEFDGASKTAREYEAAAGAFVAEFGNFTEGLTLPYRVAVDNACALHEPALSETTTPKCKEFDPANGNVYVAFDDTNASHPPFDVTAFGPLKYPEPTAAPVPPAFELTVKRTGTGSGSVTSPENGRFAFPIECPATCSGKFEAGTKVPLEATASESSKFLGWGGACSGTGTCEVTMTEAKQVTAEFESEKPTEKLDIIIEPPGSGKVTSTPSGIECPFLCSALYGKNVKVTLEAKANEGFKFSEWGGACTGTGSCEVTMDKDQEVKAIFVVATYPLTVKEEGNGEGTVTSNPLGIDCGATCSHEYEFGKEVELTQEAKAGSEFVGWGGDCTGTGPCKVKVEGPVKVTATFKALPLATVTQAHPISYTEATLHGEVQTAELETEYRFEYLTQAKFEEEGESFAGAQHTPEAILAMAEVPVAVQAHLSGLQEGTAYRFRLIAANTAGVVEAEGAFETLERRAPESCPANAEYRTGLSANLPDCRAYELVTPAQTNGLLPYAAGDGGTASGSFSNWLTVPRGEEAGERLSYFTEGTLPGFEGNGRRDGYRAERGAGGHPAEGWQSALFSPNYLQAGGGQPQQHGVAADQLYSVWETNPTGETFTETLPPGGVFLRTPEGFEALGQGSLGEDLQALSRYVSAEGSHAVFSSKAHLEPDAPPEGNVALYDRAAGDATANVLTLAPNNASQEEEEEFLAALRSKEQASFRGASEDGTAVVFGAGVGLYVRVGDAVTERIAPRTAPVGDTLSCAAGPLFQGLQQLKARRFQWLRNAAPISGAKGDDVFSVPDYTTTASDKGAALQCLTVATDLDPRSVAISAPVWVSPAEASQAPQPPAQVAPPSPASPSVGTLEACNPGSWQGAESLAYQWYDDGEAIIGATSPTYEVQAGDVPGMLQCVVKGTNAAATIARASGLTPTSPAPPEPAPVATAQAAPKTTYEGVSEDGRYVFFALGDGKSSGRLFRFDTETESSTEIASDGIFVLVSPDGSHAFFSSEEALGEEVNENGEEPEEGVHNLYAWDGAETHFVGWLAAADFENETFMGIDGMSLGSWIRALGLDDKSGRAFAPTRSTPSGNVFVFQSHARLTKYDNDGMGEIYRYDAFGKPGERLLCVSCDPSGAVPSADTLLEDVRAGTVISQKSIIPNVTDDGKAVFFQSFDRLLPDDVNEAEDVYKWTANGGGGCTRSIGCLSLISSGQGEKNSYLYEMSADARDVFFETTDKLVGVDLTGSPSIYDAREGGGIPEVTEAAPCQGDACQGQGSEPPVLPDLNTGGPGESPEAPVTRKPCAHGKHRVKGRCVTVKHRHRKRHRRSHARQGGSR